MGAGAIGRFSGLPLASKVTRFPSQMYPAGAQAPSKGMGGDGVGPAGRPQPEVGKRKDSDSLATLPGIKYGGFSALTGRVPSRPQAAPATSGDRKGAASPAWAHVHAHPPTAVAVPTLQGTSPSGSVPSGDACTAVGTWSSSSSSTGRNGRSGDQAITAWVQTQRQEKCPREGAAFNRSVALPLSRARLLGPTPPGQPGVA